jgi:RHH-type proline utilization regulon transcriptional repressor/proline dehydrogenase/delta 1-pyrroline-5-carboxylate dehydrogenase
LRRQLRAQTLADEERCVAELLEAVELSAGARHRIVRRARERIAASRARRREQGTLDAFLAEFGLSNQEGVALMCLAEALLRVPDGATADRLIAEKLTTADWADHRGHSDSLFVNASVWALMLTGRVIELEGAVADNPGGWLSRLVARSGEPVIRAAMMQAMRIMGGQFVMGRTIAEGLARAAKAPGVRHSFDMLGEGARSFEQAGRYFEAYEEAARAIGAAADGAGGYAGPGLSIKLSALYPRLEIAKAAEVREALLPRLVSLMTLAREYDIGVTIDAEESWRLDVTLDIVEALALAPELAGWNGLGLAVQAYQKRGVAQIDWLVDLARRAGRRLMVRLVKGAYWDAEIKRAQELGLDDYPVFTRKASTDLSYLVCAGKMLAAPAEIFCQFASHNAHTLEAVREMAGTASDGECDFEFQRLHGMGSLLYDDSAAEPCRVYAPVGRHEDLLPYLVRRLLENGANSSFINRFMDRDVPLEEVVVDPVRLVEEAAPKRHPRIPPPPALYGPARANARGLELADPLTTGPLLAAMATARAEPWHAAPLIDGEAQEGAAVPVRNPADRRETVGTVISASADHIEAALAAAGAAQADWNRLGGAARADILRRLGDLIEADMARLMSLCVAEAGKTIPDALAEVREAVDFCRYYANRAAELFAPAELPGPTGERNTLHLAGRGIFACISPWNFPLAIFTGQVAAALAAGNAVIAKPAEQTPLIAAAAVRLMHRAGVPAAVLHLLPGDGAVGGALVDDERIAGVAFTGSSETAKHIQRALAARGGAIVPLIAETGGQNAMIVDSTALPEQVVDDAIASAFLSAGQRCSALRVLFVQHEIADRLITMLAGAMETLKLGDPRHLATDIGPIIDAPARAVLAAHAARMSDEARLIKRLEVGPALEHGTFFAPHLFEIDSLAQLEREVFGPILHVVRYDADRLDEVLAAIRATGYGLTLGVHSRIEGRAREIFEKLAVGNTYVNRNMVGAVVGVQPFGGEGLSGTGPKAGGPHYLPRFATERVLTINTTATGGNAALFCLEED